MYTTGLNDSGQLGAKGKEGVLEPVRVSALEMHNVHAVACGQGHMVAIVDNGSLATWGSNEYGQLGEHLQPQYSHYCNSDAHINSLGAASMSMFLTAPNFNLTWGAGIKQCSFIFNSVADRGDATCVEMMMMMMCGVVWGSV